MLQQFIFRKDELVECHDGFVSRGVYKLIRSLRSEFNRKMDFWLLVRTGPSRESAPSMRRVASGSIKFTSLVRWSCLGHLLQVPIPPPIVLGRSGDTRTASTFALSLGPIH